MLKIYQTPVGCIVLCNKKTTNQIEIRTSFGRNIFHFSHYLCLSIQNSRFFSIEALFLKYDAFAVFQFNGPSKWPTKKTIYCIGACYTKAKTIEMQKRDTKNNKTSTQIFALRNYCPCCLNVWIYSDIHVYKRIEIEKA